MRQTHIVTLTFLLASATAVAAVAQQAPRVRTRARSGTVIISNGERTDTMHLGAQRGRMGITVDMRPDASRDSIGARVAGLTPGGPADKAGIQTGDIITRFNTTPLAVSDGRGGDDQEQSRPAMRLINLASRLDQGDTVRLDLRRDSRPISVTLVAAESDMDMVVGHMRMQGMPGGPGMTELHGLMPLMQGEGNMRVFAFGGPLSSLELVKVNPGLGEYFGTQDGLLVVDVGQDTALGLRAGDVILSIGGRRPTNPPQAMRILGTYEPNEAVQLEVMRQRHRTTVSGRMPARHEGGWRVEPNNFDFEMQMPDMRRMLEKELPRFERMLPRLRMERAPRVLIRTNGETLSRR